MENKLNIGELDTMVIVQAVLIGATAEGAKTKTYVEHSRPFAKVQRDQDESVGYGNLQDGRTLTLTMYKVSGMNTSWRIIVEGTPYDITSIDPISRMSPLCQVVLSAIKG